MTNPLRDLPVEVLAEALVESNLMKRYRDYAVKAGVVDKLPEHELAPMWAPEILAALPEGWTLNNHAQRYADLEDAAREVLADEPWVHDAYGEDKRCFWCYADEGSVHADDCEWKRARAVLSALDSHLSAASERETPE